jgi:hypothetical protein
MAPTISVMQPTRSSKRLRDRKEAADKAAAAAAISAVAAAATATSITTTKSHGNRKGKDAPRTVTKNRKGKAAPRKVTKPIKPIAPKNTHRYFLTLDQLSNILNQHDADGLPQQWVGGDFYAAGPGEVIPDGSLELMIKVPAGHKSFKFPDILELLEGEEMQREGEMEEEDEYAGESFDSELSECGYISDVHV